MSYRSGGHLRTLLPTLATDRLARVVVVDNASDDDSVEMATAYRDVTVIVNADNVGFGAACNIGAAATPPGADLLFLNPDATITPEHLATLTDMLRVNPTYALVAPQLFRDGRPIASSGDEATVATELRRFAPKLLARLLPERRHAPEPPHSGPVTYVEGACMLVRRAGFDAVGGFDPSFFLFFEELDLATRLRVAGWTVAMCPQARAEHLVAASRSTLSDNARPVLVASTVRYLGKRHGIAAARRFVAMARPLWRVRRWRGQLSAREHQDYLRDARQTLRDLSAP